MLRDLVEDGDQYICMSYGSINSFFVLSYIYFDEDRKVLMILKTFIRRCYIINNNS